MFGSDGFNRWADQFAYLSDVATLDLPAWQQPIAFIHQFVHSTQGDGAGSLFYNHTENIDNVANSFDALGEADLAQRVRRIDDILGPSVEDGPPNMQDILVEQCRNGAAVEEVAALDAALTARLTDIYSKLEASAKAHGWTT
jgi:hypothetical protein